MMKQITDEQYKGLRQLVIEAMQHDEQLDTGAAMDILNSLPELPQDAEDHCAKCSLNVSPAAKVVETKRLREALAERSVVTIYPDIDDSPDLLPYGYCTLCDGLGETDATVMHNKECVFFDAPANNAHP